MTAARVAADMEDEVREVDVVVVGAGQAGLSAAYHLGRYGIGAVVLDANDGPGGAWRHRWPTLRMDRVHGLHDLPDLALGAYDPHDPASQVVAAYFGRYERAYGLPVVRPVRVTAVREHGDGRLRVETGTGRSWIARALVNATGTWDKPFWPYYPGRETFRGRQLHTADYRGPEAFRDRRVVVVGGGTSAVQALLELDGVAAATTWVTRRPPRFTTEPFTPERGRAVVALVEERVRAGLPPVSVVGATGLSLTPEVRAARERGVLDRRPVFDRIVPDGVRWDETQPHHVPADRILWATGFRAALDHLAPLHLRGAGGGVRMDGTQVAADARIHVAGYGPSASTIGANRAGRTIARDLHRFLARDAAVA